MDPRELAEEDEAYLDDVFDAVTSLLAVGEDPDPQTWSKARPELAESIADVVRLAIEVWSAGSCAAPSIPGYEIVRELGRGGMGSVHLARQEALGGRLVALKVLPRGAALSAQARARFRSEVLALARIGHENVIAVFDVFDIDGVPAYAMEWVDGSSLLELTDHWVARGSGVSSSDLGALLGRALPEPRAAEMGALWGIQIAGALGAAHDVGLLHRDVKPSNVMVRRDGRALLLDFGLVRDEGSDLQTRTGAFLGTPAYAAPEQLRGGDVDVRTDVYGLGATLYHVLTGAVPFAQARQGDILRAIEEGRLRPPRQANRSLPVDLCTIVETAMEPDAARRYASAADLGGDLARFLSGEPILARPAGLLSRLSKAARRNRSSVVSALIGGAAALAVALAIGFYLARQAEIPAEIAEHVRRAHLSLLDPQFEERVAVVLHDAHEGSGSRHTWVLPFRSHEAALAEFDQALALRDDSEIRAAREVVALARFYTTRQGELPTALEGLAPFTMQVVREWFESGVEPTAQALDLGSASRRERRCLGLLALLVSSDALCIEAWRTLDLAEDPDPFVDAALGQLYRQRQQPALAWPRLERAFHHFREAGFLGTSLAEVALACGDAPYALRLLDRCRDLYAANVYGNGVRVRADALLALGRRDEARELYLQHAQRGNIPPMSHRSLAEFFESEGDYRRALHHRWRIAIRWPTQEYALEGLATTLEHWWGGLDGGGRREALRESLRAPGTFLDQLALLRAKGGLDATQAIARFAAAIDLTHLRLMEWRDESARDQDVRAQAWAEPVPDGPLPARAVTPDAPRRMPPLPPREFEFEIVSLGLDGSPARGACRDPALSAEGRFAVFSSTADNLVAGVSGRVEHIFRTDMQARATACLTAGPRDVGARDVGAPEVGAREIGALGFQADGPSRLPAISATGQRVAFYSLASNLVDGDTNEDWDCFVVDCERGLLECVSVGPDGAPTGLGGLPTTAPALSGDGRRVLYWRGPAAHAAVGMAAAVVAELGPAAGRAEVLWTTPTLERGWLGVAGALSRDGLRVTASTADATLVTPDPNHWMCDSFCFDTATGEVARTSERRGTGADFACLGAAVSPTGEWTLLYTQATNLVTLDEFSTWNLVLRNNATGEMVRVSEREDRTAVRGVRAAAATTGEVSVFEVDDAAGGAQLWWHELGFRGVRRLTQSAGTPGDGASLSPALSDDGRWVVFVSRATNLVPATAAAGGAIGQIVRAPLD